MNFEARSKMNLFGTLNISDCQVLRFCDLEVFQKLAFREKVILQKFYWLWCTNTVLH